MEQNLWKNRPCPACGGSDLTPVPIAEANRPAEDQSWETVKEAFVGLRAEQIFFSFRECSDCGQVYSPKYFDESQLQQLYSSMPGNTMGNGEDTSSKTQRNYANFILKHGILPKNYLELGPDLGLVPKALSKKGFSGSAYFVEPNTEVHSELHTLSMKLETVQVVTRLSEFQSMPKLDTIVAIHVLDHLTQPAETLRALAKLSEEGASIFIVVHNENSFIKKILGNKWPPFCLQHPQIFSPTTVREILRKSGWKASTIKRTWNYYDLGNLLDSILRLFKINSRLGGLNFIRIALPLGNFIVHAKKM